VAIEFASEIATRFDASVTGLAVVDVGHIESSARGGGIGSMHYAEKLRENLTEETRQKAQDLLHEFERALERSGVTFVDYVKEGVPFQRILDEVKYHDLLVVGKSPHFFYGAPQKETHSLPRVVRSAAAPALVVTEDHRVIQRVLIAYDGSLASARTMQQFAQLQPFGTDLEIELLHVHSGPNSESELMLRMATTYLGAHGFDKVHFTSMEGSDPAKQTTQFASQISSDLVVAGAHSDSVLKKIAFGSTTRRMLEKCDTPIFLSH
jgi:nucleotide-binding universal stress UspA family protein